MLSLIMAILSFFIQSFEVIFEYKQIFSKITFTLIAPLVFSFLSNIIISDGSLYYCEENAYIMLFQAYVPNNSPYYFDDVDKPNLFPWIFFFFGGILPIASCYIFTMLFLCTIMIKWLYLILHDTFSPSVFLASCIFCFLYLSIVWQLAGVIIVVENSCYGPRPILKAIRIVKGNTRVAFVISLVLYVYFGGVVFVFMALVMHNTEASLMWRLIMAIICGGVMLFRFLLNNVIYTLVYYICSVSRRRT